MFQIKATKRYLQSIKEIEDFIFESTNSVKPLEKFLDDHETILLFIKQNPNTPAPHPKTGDQSWPFGAGRYRVFFKVVGDQFIYLLDIIDNRMLNKDIYPNNSMPTYVLDE
jgi:hypothetical protein